MKLIWSILLLTTTSWVLAKPTIIEGTFLYQKNEKFCVGTIENSFLQDVDCCVDTISDNKGNFKITLDIEDEQILVFKSTHGKFKFYIKPSDSIHISILNIWNIKFSGSSALENNWIFANKFHKTTANDASSTEIWSDVKQKAQLEYEDQMNQLKKIRDEVTDYFYKYAKSEILGKKYSIWCSIHANYEYNNKDFEVKNYMEKEVRSFLDEPIIDNTISYNYHYTMIYCNKFLPFNPHFNQYTIDTIWQKIPNDTTKQVLQYFRAFPNYYKSIQYLAANGLIFRAKDSIDLKFSHIYMDYLKEKFPKTYSNEYLNKAFKSKSRELLLTKVVDFNIINVQKDTLKMLPQIDQKSLLIFTTTNYSISNDSLTSSIQTYLNNIESPKDFKIITIYVGDTLDNWKSKVENLKSKSDCYFLCENNLEQFKKDYFIKELPYFILTDKNLKITKKSDVYFEIFANNVQRIRN